MHMDKGPQLIHNANLITPTGVLFPGWLLSAGKTVFALGSVVIPEGYSVQATRLIDSKGAS